MPKIRLILASFWRKVQKLNVKSLRLNPWASRLLYNGRLCYGVVGEVSK
jgi:hypothetical protein